MMVEVGRGEVHQSWRAQEKTRNGQNQSPKDDGVQEPGSDLAAKS
jgi:hypothetical protein